MSEKDLVDKIFHQIETRIIRDQSITLGHTAVAKQQIRNILRRATLDSAKQTKD